MKCKLVKGRDGFSFNKIYDIKFAGDVYWVTNDYGEVIVAQMNHLKSYLMKINNDGTRRERTIT